MDDEAKRLRTLFDKTIKQISTPWAPNSQPRDTR